MRRIIVAGAAFLVSLPAWCAEGKIAMFISGNQLYSELISTDLVQRSHAMGFVTAIADAGNDGAVVLGSRFCTPDRSTPGQLVDVVRQSLETHPAIRHYSAGELTAVALQAAFPCAPK